MRRSRRPGGLRSALATFPVSIAVLTATEATAGGDRSPIVLNFDGTGTTVVKQFPDSSFQAQQLWTSNSVNGIQAFTDGTFAFANCSPTSRTPEEIDLACRIYDQATGSWSEPPIATTVPVDFLDGDFTNPYNSLFEVTGQYLTVFDVGEESFSYRLRFLDGALTPQGFPLLVGQTNPATRGAFLLRNVDAPGGTTSVTNFSIAIQTDDLCLDFALSPTAPGSTLVGSFGARERAGDGSCGEVVAEDRPVALVPSGVVAQGGATCPYRVLTVGECSPIIPYTVGGTLCLPCDGTCREDFGGEDIDIDLALTVQLEGTSVYVGCRDVIVELDGDKGEPVCGRGCTEGLLAFPIVQPSGQGLDAALAAARSPSP